MPDIVKKPGWNRQFKSHDKVNKRFMTGTEAAEPLFVTGSTPLAGPPSPPPPPPPSPPAAAALVGLECILDTPPRGFAAGALVIPITTATTTVDRSFPTPGNEEEEEEEEEEEAIDEAFIPPPSTAPAAMTQSRAGRKRAPTMKALEAEMAPKRGTGQGRGRGRGRGGRGARG
ncbi:hypothetical protein EPUS_07123 [Endocarpon pusillum Z07020]|uniref:Uncharacterized protein n=1 Tax=Endocarpon pusillum (strain Z07020 / HMAS-L-300199) TaxID=1263415 RepID=U1HUN4_ENDPU|nr:uncharacterized protein EPUS_07123 [Endocarpon pusillum Z07020]ERF73029.1 hypothetical protein EPUS_07123 [Endocarpon pusillum Z07020]